MLTIAEEMLLLVLDEKTGKFQDRLPVHSLRHAASGAVLMELALNDRIDTDVHQLFVIDPKPLGEPMLGPRPGAGSSRMAGTGRPVTGWAYSPKTTTPCSGNCSTAWSSAASWLGTKTGWLWVFGSRRYPVVEGSPLRDVKRRIMDVLLSDMIPDPRDVVVICLADACALWQSLIHPRELAGMEPRIAQVVKLDLIGQSVARTIRELQEATRGLEAKWFK